VAGSVSILIAIAAGLAVTYLMLLAALLAARPSERLLREALQLLPDLLGLLRRLAADRGLPGGVRIRLWFLLAYLATPVDLVPDFVPVLGYADDAIVVTLVLRSVGRRAGAPAIRHHWRGTEAGLAAVGHLTGFPIARDSESPT
jgi:uncharacterized membrane protein YkvA (DUF1232 family)